MWPKRNRMMETENLLITLPTPFLPFLVNHPGPKNAAADLR